MNKTASSSTRLSMSGQVELVAQTGAGPDGVAFRARLEGAEVEYRTLTPALSDPARREGVVKRLRLARLLDHPAARRVLQLELEGTPFVVLEPAAGPTLADHLSDKLPLPPVESVALALDLAAALHAAHRLGLGHGQLSPRTIASGSSGSLQLDFTGLAVRPDESHLKLSEADACAADVAALAQLLVWLTSARPFDLSASVPGTIPGSVRALVGDVLERAEAERPTIGDVEDRLRELLRVLQQQAGLDQTSDNHPAPTVKSGEPPRRQKLGRYLLTEKLGQGGMGEVWRAQDTSDGSVVAIKTLLPEYSRRPDSAQRFRKEARLLAEVNNPYVANLLEVNEDEGVHYLAVEFVPGRSVAHRLQSGKPLEESFALAIAADVCRALLDAHARGIIHRDIKPDNVLLVLDPSATDVAQTVGSGDVRAVAKLSDFGLARHVVETDSLHVTRTGAVVGTPLYLSPEQCRGEPLDPRADVYGLGATLFHLLVGRPPYVGDNPLVLINHHCNSPVPDPKSLNPALSEGACQVVTKALAKSPAHRHADAAEFLRDLTRVLRGEPASVAAHPLLPKCDAARVVEYDFRWELDASPQQLWPHVSNTERLNRAIQLPAVEWVTKPDESGRVRRTGRLRKMGIEVAWEEHPFEWVEGRRLGGLRECHSGPLKWLLSMVELEPRPGGGTVLTHHIRLEPAGLLGRTFAAVEVGVKSRRALERVYRRIDAVVRGKAGTTADAFEEPARLSRAQERRLDEALDRLAARGVDLLVVGKLGEFLATAPAQEVARIRPLALARKLGLDANALVAACLHGAQEGLVTIFWDLLCPLCRIPSQLTDTLKAMREHGHCEACNLDYELQFDKSVELIFRVHPSIREAELGVYCIGGPAHSPHVVAQVRVAPGETVELELALEEGAYRLRGPQLPAVDVRVQSGAAGVTRWEADLGHLTKASVVLRPGGQVLALLNPTAVELVARLERTADRDDALTAARAASLALFRELFPGEVLSAGRLVSVSNVTLLASEVVGLGELSESDGFARLHDHLRQLEALARENGGALVKASGDGGLAAFSGPAEAVRALLKLPASGLRVALHRGPALAATINDTLDYFGVTVRRLHELLRRTVPGERLASQAVLDDPAAMAALTEAGAASEVAANAGGLVHRVLARG
jgi:eukaryotic-like serine/threonine-protein kinase